MNIYTIKDIFGDEKAYSNLVKVSEKTNIKYHRMYRQLKDKGFFFDGKLLIKRLKVL